MAEDRAVKITRPRFLAALVVASTGFGAASCGQHPAGEPESPEAQPEAQGSEGFEAGAFDSLPWAPGTLDRETGTYRLSVPRQDLVVRVDGVLLADRSALEGWVVFKPVPGGAVLSAELPLLVDEVNPVISAALLHELRVTALHSHFSREEPRLMYLHLSAIGETDSLATAVGAVLQTLEDAKGLPRVPAPQFDQTATTFDPASVDSVLGVRGQMQQGVYELTFPRSTRLDGFDLGGASGIATRVTFAGSAARAVASGRLALLESELQPVLRVLRAAGIDIASIGNVLIGEEPRIVFVHFRGRGPATDLARAIREALDVMAPVGD